MNAEHETNFPAFENRDYYVDLGEHISFYRKRANITQRELASRVNISRSYLSRIENPKSSPDIKQMDFPGGSCQPAKLYSR